jgi:phosphonate transport system ATP-binding protein
VLANEPCHGDLLRDLSAGSKKTLLLNLHSVELALASFPRIVGIRDGRVAFDLAPHKVTGEMLRGLYAGEDEAGEVERFDEIIQVSGVCRPLRK